MLSLKSLVMVGLASFASMVALRVCDSMLTTLANEFHVSLQSASQVISAYAIAYGILQLLYGPLGDRYGKLRVIALAAFACAFFSMLNALAYNFPLLVWSRVALAAAAAGIIPLSMAWVGDRVPYAQRQESLAKLLLATVSGMMLGQWLGGFTAEQSHWRWAFVVLALLFLLAAWLLQSLLATHAEAPQQAPLPFGRTLAQSWQVLRLPRVQWVISMTFLEGTLAFGAIAFIPSQLIGSYGLSAATAGAIMVLFGVGGLVYIRYAKRWLAAVGERGLALGGGTLIMSGLLLLAWLPHTFAAALGCCLSGLGFYMLHNTLQTQATQMAPHARGVAVTLFACVLFLGNSLGVVLVAGTLEHGQLSLGLSAAALGLMLLACFIARGCQTGQKT